MGFEKDLELEDYIRDENSLKVLTEGSVSKLVSNPFFQVSVILEKRGRGAGKKTEVVGYRLTKQLHGERACAPS